MAEKTREIGMATVNRLAHVKPGIRVNADAVEMVRDKAEDYIRNIFLGALTFTDHRNGTMIMKKDVEAYLKSIS